MKKLYWVDFECWSIEAESYEEVRELVEEKVCIEGSPDITNIELQDSSNEMVEESKSS